MHAAGRDDPEPKALACYGLWLPERERMLLRFVAGRPVGAVTCAFLAWGAQRMAADGVRGLALIWGNAPRHVSRAVRARVGAHNRRGQAPRRRLGPPDFPLPRQRPRPEPPH